MSLQGAVAEVQMVFSSPNARDRGAGLTAGATGA